MLSKFITYLILVVVLMSINEWCVHKFIMHNSKFSLGYSHISHHKETNYDMSLKKNMNILDTDKHRGTAFCYKTSAYTFIVALIQILTLWYIFFNKNYIIPVLLTVFISVYQGVVWNSVHTKMHGMPNVDYNIGYPSIIPSKYLSSKYLSFLEKNHIKHHRSKGTKYFNITLPIADYIFGTY